MSHVFSDTQDVDDPVAHCDPAIIPIFPLRFALTADAVLGMLKKDTTPDTPTSIDGLSQHELLRIRRGYVYIFANKKFQVFRFETQINDENGCFYRADTPTPSSGQPYTFNKYSWPDGAQGKWIPEKKTYPYAFVPKQTPIAWVAYSEGRWPYRWLFEAETNDDFRKEIMTEVNLSTRQGDFCAPLSELEQRVPAFRKSSVDFVIQDYSVANAIRHTSVEVEHQAAVVHCTNARDKGVLVALHDPIGEIQEILALMSIHSQTLANYVSEHQYPMVMGKAVQNYFDNGKVSTTRLKWLEGPLSTEFQTEYSNIVKQADDIEKAQEGLVKHWARKVGKTGFGSLLQQLDVCASIAEKYSYKVHPINHTENIAFWHLLHARMMSSLACSQTSSKTLITLFDPSQISAPNKSFLGQVASSVQRALAFSAFIVGGSKSYHKALAPAINALFTVYGTQVVSAAVGPNDNATRQLINTIFSSETRQLNSPDDLKEAFSDIMTREGYSAAIPDQAQQHGTNITASRQMTPTVDNPNKIGLIEFHTQVDLSMDADYLKHARYSNNFELGSNGIGMVAAGLSLYTTMADWNKSRRDASDLGEFVSRPTTKLVAAFADAYAGIHGTSTAMLGRGSQAATSTVITRIFSSNVALVNSAASTGARGARSIATTSMAGAARVAGYVGVAMSAAAAWEGYQRDDMVMFAGNGMMALGGLILTAGLVTGPLALVVLGVVVVGLVLSLYSYDDAQRWVESGFWGTSDDYWADERDKLIQDQIITAKAIAIQNHADHQWIQDKFKKELAWYLDINSELKIEDASSKDGKVEIRCATLQSAADLSRLRATASYPTDGPLFSTINNSIAGISVQFIKPGLAQAFIPAGNYPGTGSITIKAELNRVPNGKFNAEKAIKRSLLW